MVVIAVDLRNHVGSGLQIGHQDFALLVSLENAQAHPVTPDFKGDVRQDLEAAAVEFLDAQAGLFLVRECYRGGLAADDAHRLNGVSGGNPALNTCGFPDFPTTRPQLGKLNCAAGAGLAGLGFPGGDVLDLNGNSGERFAGIAVLLHTEVAKRLIVERDLGNLPMDHLDVLGNIFGDQVPLGRVQLLHGVVAGQRNRHLYSTVCLGRERADSRAVRAGNLEYCALQRGPGPGFQLVDLDASSGGSGRRRGSARVARFTGGTGVIRSVVAADKRTFHGPNRVGIQHIVLDVAVLVGLERLCVVDFILNYFGPHVQLDGARLPRYTGGRIDDFALALVAAFYAEGIHRQFRDLLVVHVQDFRSAGCARCQGQRNAVIGPSAAGNGNYLLIVGLAVDCDRICAVLICGGGQLGAGDRGPGSSPCVNPLGCLQDPLRGFPVRSRQIGVDPQAADAPAAQEINPQRGFRGVVRFLRAVQLQGGQRLVGVSIANNAADLGVRHGVGGAVLDGCTLRHQGWNAVQPGVHTVGGNLLGPASLSRFKPVIGVMLFFDAAVHGQPVQRTALGIYVHLSHRLLQRGGGEYRGGQDAQQSNKRQEKRKDTFFQNKFLLIEFWA